MQLIHRYNNLSEGDDLCVHSIISSKEGCQYEWERVGKSHRYWKGLKESLSKSDISTT